MTLAEKRRHLQERGLLDKAQSLALEHGITLEEMFRDRHFQSEVKARQAFALFLKIEKSYSSVQTAQLLADLGCKRDRSTFATRTKTPKTAPVSTTMLRTASVG